MDPWLAAVHPAHSFRALCVTAFRSGERELDPARSGLYLPHPLLTACSLERQGLPLEELLGDAALRP